MWDSDRLLLYLAWQRDLFKLELMLFLMLFLLVHKSIGLHKTLGTHSLLAFKSFTSLFMFTRLLKLELDSLGLTGLEILKWL